MKRLLRGIATRLGARPAAPAQSAAPNAAQSAGPSTPTQAAQPAQRATLHKPGPPPKHVSDKLLQYAPQLDGAADPGEVVWTWVQYEDDPNQGKDRPVLVVGRKGTQLVGLMLSSQSERDGQRNWFALGPGSWDRDERPSWIRLDRVLTVEEHGIRREGAVLDRERFDRIAERLRGSYGWD